MSPPYIIGDSSPMLKRILIPFWIIRICIMLVQIGIYALVITGLSVFKNDAKRLAAEYDTALSYNAIFAVCCIIVVIVLACLILDIVCIVMRARRTLSPPFFFGVTLAQSIFYSVNFILSMIGARSKLSIGVGVFTLLSFLGLLAYASVIYHQYRTGTLQGAYSQAHNPEAHNFVPENTGFAPNVHPQPYAHEYPKTAYYDPQAMNQTHTYAGAQGVVAASPYEPYGGQHGGQQQGIEMTPARGGAGAAV